MSRKYSAWASNQPVVNTDIPMMRLATVVGNEQDQIKQFEKVEAIPHMYINIDAPPPPTTTKIDARPAAMQPVMISRQNSSYFGAPTSTNVPTKVWPIEKSAKNTSIVENAPSTSKRHHKHKHHHHRHHHHDHNDKHHRHHHHHHNQRYRAKSAESIRNRPHQTLISPSKMILANPQYFEQDQFQQQQQPQQMIVYRELGNNEGYTVDPNGLATVPYLNDNETTTFVDDQQAPMIVYRDANNIQHQQHPSSLITDTTSQQLFFNPDQETVIQQTDPFIQPSSQIVYCTDPHHQDFHCTSHNNIIQHSISPPPTQQQFVCLDHTPTSTIQPTIVNQIPVFNSLPTTQSIANIPQASALQRATSVIIQQPQTQAQPVQIVQQPTQPLQIVHQAQPLQVIQQPAQPLQIIQNPQTQPGQILQLAPAAPQVIQTVQPQVIQAQPILQTIQMPTQTIGASPQILYQRPYDPVIVPVQNQQMTIANPPLVALSQPSYAPSRIIPATTGGIQPTGGANMFRHALLRTVADRTGVPVPTAPVGGGMQLMQTTTGVPVAATTPNLVAAGGLQRSASLPIIPLTPGGILIPFQPAQQPGLRPGPLPRIGGYPTNLRNFNDIRQLMQQRREQLMQNLRQPVAYSRIPSPPVISAAPRSTLSTPYTSGNIFSSGYRPIVPSPPSVASGTYQRLPTSGLTYSSPPFAGSIRSASSAPYTPLRT